MPNAEGDERVCARPRMRERWYVVQVMAGREDHMRREILQAIELEERLASERAEAAGEAAPPAIVHEVFVPKARVGVNRDGKWLPGEEVLLPGYLIVIAEDPVRVSAALHRVEGFARVVRQDNVFVPLLSQSVEWLERQTRRGSDAAGMSEGYMQDDVLHVTAGPLVGREAQVVKVDHRKKRAYLEVEAFGRKVTVQLGLRITRNRDCKKNRLKTE